MAKGWPKMGQGWPKDRQKVARRWPKSPKCVGNGALMGPFWSLVGSLLFIYYPGTRWKICLGTRLKNQAKPVGSPRAPNGPKNLTRDYPGNGLVIITDDYR